MEDSQEQAVEHPSDTYHLRLQWADLSVLVEEGDMIEIDINNLSIKLDVSDEELAKRKAAWTPREPRVTTGYLARYAAMVTSGNRGAVLEVPKN